MRRLFFTTLLVIVPLIASGCRQATGPTGGPLTPLGPASALSPVGAGQSPSLGPFGGPTRVTPPATGSYVAPNNYMGAVPSGQANLGVAGNGNPAGTFDRRDEIIGSGVQVATWNETDAVVGQTGASIHSSATIDPRSGGMQVIDLTGAPPPPGYRPSVPSFPNGFPSGSASQSQYPNFQNPGVQGPGVQNQGMQSPGIQNQGVQDFGSGVQSINVPSPGQIANSAPLVPLQEFPSSVTPIGSVAPRTATASGPSTEPVNAGESDGQNLPWRRPGTRF